MKKYLILFIIMMLLSACSKDVSQNNLEIYPLSVEQVNQYNIEVKKFLSDKSWIAQGDISFYKIKLPLGVKNTYFEEILKKSKDSGYDMTQYLGKDAMEGVIEIKYSSGDVAGVAHFIYAQDKLIGAYYLSNNYIYSLNEKEIFKKQINWNNVEDLKKRFKYEESKLTLNNFDNLIYSGKYDEKVSYIFGLEENKLKIYSLEEDEFTVIKEIKLDQIYLQDIFFKDVDQDNKSELALLLSNNKDLSLNGTKSKLIIYEIEEKLKVKYSIDFEYPMWSIDYDGKNIIATSQKSIEMYSSKKDKLTKIYSYNKVGGHILVDDLDKSGSLNYILLDSEGKDIYVFQNNNGFEEIWRSYNTQPMYNNIIQTGDLNHDGAKEIYLSDKQGNINKMILQQEEFLEQDLVKNHRYFIGDFNSDGQDEYLDFNKQSNSIIYYH